MNQNRPGDIKRRVIAGNATTHQPAALLLNKAHGTMWATNKYWATEAVRVEPLLRQYNLSAEEPGWFDVDARGARPTGHQPPDIERMVRDVASFTLTAKRATVGGQAAYALTHKGEPMALYELEDGTIAGLDADVHDWLRETHQVLLPERERVGDVRALFRKPETGGVMAAFIAHTVRIIDPPGHELGTYVPAVTEPGEPRLLGVMMAVKYQD